MFWQFLIEYQSIFASLLTLIVTLILTHILRNMGRTYFTFLEYNFYISTQDSDGFEISKPNINKSDYSDIHGAGFSFELILYNNSESPKSLSGFNIELISNSSKIVLPATTKSIRGGAISHMDEIKVANLPSKNMSHYKLHCNIPKQNLKDEKYTVYFLCRNVKGRTIRKYISTYQFVV